MSADTLHDVSQLKRRAKELLRAFRGSGPEAVGDSIYCHSRRCASCGLVCPGSMWIVMIQVTTYEMPA